MNKALLFSLVCITFFSFFSCSDRESVNPEGIDKITNESIIADSSELNLTSDATSVQIRLKTKSAWESRMIDECDWLFFSPEYGPAASYLVTVDVAANNSYDSREGRIELYNKERRDTLTIRQAGRGEIIIAKTDYVVEHTGGQISVYTTTNVEINVSCSEDWVKHIETRAMEDKTVVLDISPNSTGLQRKCIVSFSNSSINKTVEITQKGDSEVYTKERNALIALYRSLDGDNWHDDYGTPVREGWLSDNPVGTWNGIKTDNLGRVIAIERTLDNLDGELPDEIGDFEYLEVIRMSGNRIKGSIPKTIANCKNLKEIFMGSNELSGEIPKELFECTKLELIDLPMNNLSGALPEEVGNLTNLWCLGLRNNLLSGELPNSLGKLKCLEQLIIDGNSFTGSLPDLKECTSLIRIWGAGNDFSGTIPESYGNLTKLKDLDFTWCGLSGTIPNGIIQNRDLWVSCWGWIVYGNNFDLTNVEIPAPTFKLHDIDGNIIDSSKLYKSNKLTMFFQWNEGCVVSNSIFPLVAHLYDEYHKKGLEVIGLPFDHNEEYIRKMMQRQNATWPNIVQGEGNWLLPTYISKNIYHRDHIEDESCFPYYPTSAYPAITIIDNKGYVVFSDIIDNPNSMEDFVRHQFELNANSKGHHLQILK